jgi:hypothetical protein
MVYGSSYDENAFQVDGVDITDNYFNEALAEPNTDAIEEVEVLSLGAPAEYGNLTGAVYNIVTRPGDERLPRRRRLLLAGRWPDLGQQQEHGEPRRHVHGRLPGRRPLPLDARQVHDLSLQIGGPVVKDKLWFFASYANQRTTTGTWVSTTQRPDRRRAGPTVTSAS